MVQMVSISWASSRVREEKRLVRRQYRAEATKATTKIIIDIA